MRDPEPTADSLHSDILKIVLVYAVFAGLWILLSDEAVAWLFVDSTAFHIAGTLKGWFFVAFTSPLLYLLLNKLVSRGGRNSESIHRSALVNWKTWQLYLFAVAATLFTLLLRQRIASLFIQDLTVDPEDDALVKTILAVAKLMHVKVVAEGVETAGQAAFLNQRGHVIHQGYLFGRPEHAETVIANIAKNGL